MCKRPVKFSSFGVNGAERKRTLPDARHWNYLGIVSGRKDLIRLLKVVVSERFLDHAHIALTQQADYSLARDACQKSSIRNGREHHTVFCHEDIRGSEFSDIAQRIADDGIVEAPRVRLKKRTGIVGIKTSRFGIDRHGFESGPAKGRQRDGETLGRAHGGFINRKTPAGGLGIVSLHPGPFVLRPIHRPNVKRGVLIEFLHTLAGQAEPLFGRNDWFQVKLRRRGVHARAVEAEVGRNSFKSTGAVEYHGAQPCGVGARTHDRDITFPPITLEIGPGPGPAAPDAQSTPPATGYRGIYRLPEGAGEVPDERLNQHARRIHWQNDDFLSLGQPIPLIFWFAENAVLLPGTKVRHHAGIGFWNVAPTSPVIGLPDLSQYPRVRGRAMLVSAKSCEQRSLPHRYPVSEYLDFLFKEFFLTLKIETEETCGVEEQPLAGVRALAPEREGNFVPVHGVEEG